MRALLAIAFVLQAALLERAHERQTTTNPQAIDARPGAPDGGGVLVEAGGVGVGDPTPVQGAALAGVAAAEGAVDGRNGKKGAGAGGSEVRKNTDGDLSRIWGTVA